MLMACMNIRHEVEIYRVSAEMTTNNFKLIKQGQLIEWTFNVYG